MYLKWEWERKTLNWMHEIMFRFCKTHELLNTQYYYCVLYQEEVEKYKKGEREMWQCLWWGDQFVWPVSQ